MISITDISPKIVNNFWDHTRVSTPDKCWEWLGSKTTGGYGEIRIGRIIIYAHRIAYVIKNGSIPEGLCICHKCDNPSCVNPDHLFAGTHKDNIQDMLMKGRRKGRGKSKRPAVKVAKTRRPRPPRRPDSHAKKLTISSVLEIRASYIPRKNSKELADKYGISVVAVRDAAKGRSWKGVS
jgi:hypothetical protein